MTSDENPLFYLDPLADLAKLIQEAQDRKASRLLILAGKSIVCRVEGKLSPPMLPERIHFRQTQALADALLNEEQQHKLDADGSVEIDYKVDGQPEPLSMNIFFGDGAHNVVVFLTPGR